MGCESDRCGQEIVCACLQITEKQLLAAVTGRDVCTLMELRRVTGAGDGCTACHHVLQRFLPTSPLDVPLAASSNSSVTPTT